MKATVKQIFREIQGLNPSTSEISSVGTYVSQSAQMVADSIYREVITAIPKTSLAYKILLDSKFLSEKQLWVIAFELEKNIGYSETLGTEIEKRERKSKAKIDASKSKLAHNKENSQEILDFIKSNSKKLADYYDFVKRNKQFSKEFYSKKFTFESANAFLS